MGNKSSSTSIAVIGLAVEKLGYKQDGLGCLQKLDRLTMDPGKEQSLSHFGPMLVSRYILEKAIDD